MRTTALDQPEQHRRAELVLDQARQPDRDDEEEADREHERQITVPPTRRPRSLLLAVGQLRVGRDPSARRPIPSDSDERHHTADDGQAVDAALARGRAGQREVRTSMVGARRLAAGVRTATAQWRTPRIITPSRTAWPPDGGVAVPSAGRRSAAGRPRTGRGREQPRGSRV